MSGFIFSKRSLLVEAIDHASKASYPEVLIIKDEAKFEKFEILLQIQSLVIKELINAKHNKLKKSNPESFFF